MISRRCSTADWTSEDRRVSELPDHASERDQHPDLLARPPCGSRSFEEQWAAFVIDPVAQVRALAGLRDDGLLSDEEFERQKAKVLGP